MSKSRILDEEKIEKLRPRAKRYDVADGDVRNLYVRVGRQTKTFVLAARFGNARNPTRREIGKVGKMSIEEAREVAREWNLKIRKGIDPGEENRKAEEEARRAEDERHLAVRNTFGAVVKDFIIWLPERANAEHAERDGQLVRRCVLGTKHQEILEKAMGDITALDVENLLTAIRDKPAPAEAYNLFTQLSAFFTWILLPSRAKAYGMGDINPMANLKQSALGLSKNKRTTFMDSNEARAYWRAADKTAYPYGPYFKAILLVPARKSSMQHARWSQIDWEQKIWEIPNKLDKMKQEHWVPIGRRMTALLREIQACLPEGHGDYIFSSSNGQRPINGIGKEMAKFMRLMEAEFREINPTRLLKHLILHDDRRFARTAMAALKVPPHVAELVIGHRKKGMAGIYDQHEYVAEMREALNRYADRLFDIIDGSAATFSVDVPDPG